MATVNATDDVSFDKFLNTFNSTGRRESIDMFHKLGINVYHQDPAESEYPLIPTWVLMMYLIIVNGFGVVLNLLICIGYLMQKHKIGAFTLVLNVAISDLISLTLVSVPEMWAHHIGNWTFGKAICLLYLGCEVLASTSCIYFLIAMNFHALATINAYKNGSKRDSEQQLLQEVAEMKSSQHSLVPRSETSTPTRTTNPENTSNRTVPVTLPILFVWVLSAALSFPEFPLSTVIDSRSGISVCTFINGHHLTSMRILLCVFQLLLPFVILSTTSAMIVHKLCSSKERGEADLTLKLALFLCCLFLVFSAPRFSLATFQSFWSDYDKEGTTSLDRFRTPPLHYSVTPVAVPFVFSFLHFLTPVIKPFAYIYFLMKKRKTNTTRRRQLHNDAETS